MESDFQDDTKKDDDWGRPPSPLTPEDQKSFSGTTHSWNYLLSIYCPTWYSFLDFGRP